MGSAVHNSLNSHSFGSKALLICCSPLDFQILVAKLLVVAFFRGELTCKWQHTQLIHGHINVSKSDLKILLPLYICCMDTNILLFYFMVHIHSFINPYLYLVTSDSYSFMWAPCQYRIIRVLTQSYTYRIKRQP